MADSSTVDVNVITNQVDSTGATVISVTQTNNIESTTADINVVESGSGATKSTISTGTSAPATTPDKVGDIFVDTSGQKLYFAIGISSSADWIIAN